jgi:hypothetical protein
VRLRRSARTLVGPLELPYSVTALAAESEDSPTERLCRNSDFAEGAEDWALEIVINGHGLELPFRPGRSRGIVGPDHATSTSTHPARSGKAKKRPVERRTIKEEGMALGTSQQNCPQDTFRATAPPRRGTLGRNHRSWVNLARRQSPIASICPLSWSVTTDEASAAAVAIQIGGADGQSIRRPRLQHGREVLLWSSGHYLINYRQGAPSGNARIQHGELPPNASGCTNRQKTFGFDGSHPTGIRSISRSSLVKWRAAWGKKRLPSQESSLTVRGLYPLM